jgi:hypothetical protein
MVGHLFENLVRGFDACCPLKLPGVDWLQPTLLVLLGFIIFDELAEQGRLF